MPTDAPVGIGKECNQAIEPTLISDLSQRFRRLTTNCPIAILKQFLEGIQSLLCAEIVPGRYSGMPN
jgi:hypothetical protein